MPVVDTLQRTTTAVTIIKSGYKSNVLPSYAEFTVNHRIHNAQSCREVFQIYFKLFFRLKSKSKFF
jgi:acetylornithine deacetylase/succinyl-diaminopimelate desuccinylase-like protein